MKYRETLLEL